jgi:hypothetical protein
MKKLALSITAVAIVVGSMSFGFTNEVMAKQKPKNVKATTTQAASKPKTYYKCSKYIGTGKDYGVVTWWLERVTFNKVPRKQTFTPTFTKVKAFKSSDQCVPAAVALNNKG